MIGGIQVGCEHARLGYHPLPRMFQTFMPEGLL